MLRGRRPGVFVVFLFLLLVGLSTGQCARAFTCVCGQQAPWVHGRSPVLAQSPFSRCRCLASRLHVGCCYHQHVYVYVYMNGLAVDAPRPFCTHRGFLATPLVGSSRRLFGIETYGTLGARGDAYLRDVVRNYARPVTWLDAPADKGPKFVDHGGRYSIFVRRLRERISMTLQRGNAAFIRKWLDNCVPRGAAAQAWAAPTLGAPAPPRRRGRERPWRHGHTTHTPCSECAPTARMRNTYIYHRDLV